MHCTESGWEPPDRELNRGTSKRSEMEAQMRKRLAVFAATAVTALGVSAGASAAIWNFPPQSHPGAPAGMSCPQGDLACKAPSR